VVVPGTFTHLVPPGSKEYCTRYSWKTFKCYGN